MVFFRFGVATSSKVASGYGRVPAVTDHKLGVQLFIFHEIILCINM